MTNNQFHQGRVKRDIKLSEASPIHIVGEDWNFAWHYDEIEQVKRLWRQGEHVEEIAKAFYCTPSELFILTLELSERGYIEPRRGGLLGGTIDGWGNKWLEDYQGFSLWLDREKQKKGNRFYVNYPTMIVAVSCYNRFFRHTQHLQEVTA